MFMSDAVGPLVGILGVLFGIILSEFLRRGQRVEQYASIIFSKRLEAYELLLKLVHDGEIVADEVINNSMLSDEERNKLISSIIFPIANHTDSKILYIDSDLGAHCVALFMGVEDLHTFSDNDKKTYLEEHFKMRRETRRMIMEDAGIGQISKLFRSINRPLITSPVIERIRELRAEQKAK